MRKIIVSFLSVFMFLSLSVYSVFASENLPYFKTVRKEEIKLYGAPVSLDIKHIENVENKKVQKQINERIDGYVKATLKKKGEELSQTPELKYIQLAIGVSDYYVSKDIASYSLDFLEIMADSYEAKQYYTTDLKTGEDIKINYWLGDNYAKLVKEEVLKQVQQQNKENGSEIYFMDVVNNLKITENQSYYINKDGYVVVTFPKYDIAPAYVGLPEFIMPNNIKGVI